MDFAQYIEEHLQSILQMDKRRLQMTILDIIEKKRNKKQLTKEEIEYFVEEYTNGNFYTRNE